MRQQRRRIATWTAVTLGLLLQACSTPPRQTTTAPSTGEGTQAEWQGRLSVQVQSEPPTSMSAGFLLRGDARNGELDLYSPLGTTLGALQWSPKSVQLNQSGSRQYFASMAELTEKTTGAALPIDALFQWLQGTHTPVDGWIADLSRASQGTVSARRSMPLPEVTLRIQLD
jgi:outer membrane lipoprotein LolB